MKPYIKSLILCISFAIWFSHQYSLDIWGSIKLLHSIIRIKQFSYWFFIIIFLMLSIYHAFLWFIFPCLFHQYVYWQCLFYSSFPSTTLEMTHFISIFLLLSLNFKHELLLSKCPFSFQINKDLRIFNLICFSHLSCYCCLKLYCLI